jgi:hypothetical protein
LVTWAVRSLDDANTWPTEPCDDSRRKISCACSKQCSASCRSSDTNILWNQSYSFFKTSVAWEGWYKLALIGILPLCLFSMHRLALCEAYRQNCPPNILPVKWGKPKPFPVFIEQKWRWVQMKLTVIARDAVYSGRCLLTLRRNMLPPYGSNGGNILLNVVNINWRTTWHHIPQGSRWWVDQWQAVPSVVLNLWVQYY